MFSFLNPRRKVASGSYAATDLHGLWLPGLDGCAADVGEALELIAALHDAGFRNLYATPGVGSGFPGNQPERIRGSYESLLPEIRKRWPDLRTGLAATYELDSRFYAHLKKLDFLTLPGERLLLRFPEEQEPLDLSDMLFRIRIKGYKVLLLQPEVLPYYTADSGRFKRLREKEVGLVVGLASLAGLHGRPVQKQTEALLLNGMAEWCCSGITDARDASRIREIELPAKLARHLEQRPFRSP